MCARLHLPWLRSGERIETPGRVAVSRWAAVISPGFGQGSGLKLPAPHEHRLVAGHLPWLRSGERIETAPTRCCRSWGSNLPWLRSGERIETAKPAPTGRMKSHLPWLRSGERIETSVRLPAWARPGEISPGFGQGSRLKPSGAARSSARPCAVHFRDKQYSVSGGKAVRM